jgi:hypothetical protein
MNASIYSSKGSMVYQMGKVRTTHTNLGNGQVTYKSEKLVDGVWVSGMRSKNGHGPIQRIAAVIKAVRANG